MRTTSLLLSLTLGGAAVLSAQAPRAAPEIRPFVGISIPTGTQRDLFNDAPVFGLEGAVEGRVGNTGNTGEPHLHIHAQRPGTADARLSGSPLPIRFGDRYPVRNARIKV